MVSTVIAEASSVSGNRAPERSGAELNVSSSAWLVDFPPLVLRAVEGAGATDMMDLLRCGHLVLKPDNQVLQ